MRNLISPLLLVSASLLAGTATTGGCSSSLNKVETYSDPADDFSLSKCRSEGRASFQASEGKTREDAQRAYEVYVLCACDAGFCKDGAK